MKIGYLGPEGTYTQQAANEFTRNMHDVQLTAIDSIRGVFVELFGENIDFAIVPLANSLAGSYRETAEGVTSFPVRIVGSFRLQIKLAIGIHPDSDKSRLTEIRSKDTALSECSDYLQKNFPAAKQVATESTARAMQQIKNKALMHAGAIGSGIGLSLYGLKLIDDNIGNQEDNYTTFIILKKLLVNYK
jgi:prephenate dehydratase